jgi:hypothetical protein
MIVLNGDNRECVCYSDYFDHKKISNFLTKQEIPKLKPFEELHMNLRRHF